MNPLTALLSSKYLPWVTGGLSTVAGLVWIVPLIQGSHPVAAADVAAACGFALSALHLLSGSIIPKVTLAKAATLEKESPK